MVRLCVTLFFCCLLMAVLKSEEPRFNLWLPHLPLCNPIRLLYLILDFLIYKMKIIIIPILRDWLWRFNDNTCRTLNTEWQLAEFLEHFFFFKDLFIYFRERAHASTAVTSRGRGRESLKADSALSPMQGSIPQSQNHDLSQN